MYQFCELVLQHKLSNFCLYCLLYETALKAASCYRCSTKYLFKWNCFMCYSSVIPVPVTSWERWSLDNSIEDFFMSFVWQHLVQFWQVNALCAGVQDSSVLVQRSALDLLLVGFPMHNSHLVRADMVRLVTAALVTILRRDMSLNR